MKYDFTSILDRRGKDAIAIEAVGAPGSAYPAPKEGFDVIPMWLDLRQQSENPWRWVRSGHQRDHSD